MTSGGKAVVQDEGTAESAGLTRSMLFFAEAIRGSVRALRADVLDTGQSPGRLNWRKRANILIRQDSAEYAGLRRHARRRSQALPPVPRFRARRIRLPVRAHAVDQGAVQALRALPALARPHARDGVREGLDA